MPTQEQVFTRIKANHSKRKVQPVVPSEEEVTKILRQMYDPKLLGPRFFYFQDANDMPVDKIPTRASSGDFFPTVADSNVFRASDWSREARPEGFTGKSWPPKRLSHLIGSPNMSEQCICRIEADNTCDCDPKTLSQSLREFWIENIAIRSVGGRGFGLFARKPIQTDSIVGEYTGNVEPRRDDAPDDETEYHTSISIGTDATDEVTAWIDATRTGSVARFINHSCNANCHFWESRCGMRSRVVYVGTIRDIEAGEELTFNYGSDWFEDADHVCLCGESNCKNPPTIDKSDHDDVASEDDEVEYVADDEDADDEPVRKKVRR
jgi:hypothetical protein